MIHSLRDDVIHDSSTFFSFLAVIHDSRFRFHPPDLVKTQLKTLSVSIKICTAN